MIPLMRTSNAATSAGPTYEQLAIVPHRRQFLIGPRYLPEFASWRIEELGQGLVAHVHQDLNFVKFVGDKINLYLLGFMIHAHQPDWTDLEILQDLAAGEEQVGILQRTFPLGGRWVLFVEHADGAWIINDACGLRSLVYTNDLVDEGWYASDPALVAKAIPLEPDRAAQCFLESVQASGGAPDYCFPGVATLFKETEQLLPNHLLDAASRTQRRFFPTVPLLRLAVDDAASKMGELLANIIAGVCNRYPPSLALTAGMDSRTILAASRQSIDKLRCYTVSHRSRRQEPADVLSDPDVSIAREVARCVGVEHDIVLAEATQPKNVSSILADHTTAPHWISEEWIAALIDRYSADRISINGTCSEIIRGKYYPFVSKHLTSAGDLARALWRGSDHVFVRPKLEVWAQDTARVCRQTNYMFFELAHWELRLGRWLSQLLLEQDLAIETVSPYNCRELICVGLSVDWRLRSFPSGCRLHRTVIEKMSPECLAVPIHMKSRQVAVRRNLRALMGGRGLRELVSWRRRAS